MILNKYAELWYLDLFRPCVCIQVCVCIHESDVRIRFSRLMSSSFILSEKSYIGYFPAIFAANRARVNNFPGACGTTSRKTMSADRGIEGERSWIRECRRFSSLPTDRVSNKSRLIRESIRRRCNWKNLRNSCGRTKEREKKRSSLLARWSSRAISFHASAETTRKQTV